MFTVVDAPASAGKESSVSIKLQDKAMFVFGPAASTFADKEISLFGHLPADVNKKASVFAQPTTVTDNNVSSASGQLSFGSLLFGQTSKSTAKNKERSLFGQSSTTANNGSSLFGQKLAGGGDKASLSFNQPPQQSVTDKGSAVFGQPPSTGGTLAHTTPSIFTFGGLVAPPATSSSGFPLFTSKPTAVISSTPTFGLGKRSQAESTDEKSKKRLLNFGNLARLYNEYNYLVLSYLM